MDSYALTRADIPFDFGFGPVTVVEEDKTDMQEDEVHTHYVAAMLYGRAFAVDLFPDGRITFEPGMGFGYSRMSHGHSFILGGRVNIFDVLGMTLLQNFEVNNDAADRFVVTVDLGFRFGRRMTGLNRLF
jgi:hypothetical protein